MASRIQGITVEIGGDTTKLSKALEGVNKSIKGTQSGLKDVNKLLKLDPSNTELVVQKQKMLKDAIQATKEKLATLKTAAQQANEQLANGEITQQQYDALQREIVETEQNLRSLQDQAATTNATLAKIDEAGEKLQNIGSSVENVGKKFLPVTAAVTGLGTAAVKTAADFDSEMSKVSAISGATGDDFDQLRAKAREMGAKTKFSASEAASAMEYMAMAGWKTGDMLNGIEGIMNLAAASGEDLATTSDIVTDALTAFGLSAADSGHFADILAAASSNANTNVSMMGETFKYCAPIAGALGFSAEDTAEAIGLMANSGIKASQAGTSLRTIMNNLSGEEQENNAEVMNRLNLSGYEVVRAQYFSTLQNPAMTISNGKLRFNTSCLKKFEDVEYVELLLNSVDRCVAIRPCEKGNPNAIHWGRLKEGRWCASTLGCRGLAKTLFDIMEWEEGLKYRFRGQFVEQGDNKLMLFELDEPEMIKIEEIVLPPKEEEAEGKTVKQTIYIFPPEWAGTFGQPITSIAQVGILQQEHYAGNWDVLRPAAEIKEMNTFTADGLNALLHEAEEIMEGWTDTNE